jgi:hypothetical protein
MSRLERRLEQAGSAVDRAPAVQSEAEAAELARRREARERATAELRDSQAALEWEEAAAQERLHALDARIESLLSADPQEFVIRFIQTGGQ